MRNPSHLSSHLSQACREQAHVRRPLQQCTADLHLDKTPKQHSITAGPIDRKNKETFCGASMEKSPDENATRPQSSHAQGRQKVLGILAAQVPRPELPDRPVQIPNLASNTEKE